MANLLFYLTAAGAVASALYVVLARNPIANVLALLACFFCLATIYLLAGFQLIAALQILVYAGAIMVLFLFVIMLLNLGAPGPLPRIQASLIEQRKVLLTVAITGALLAVSVLAIPRATRVTGQMPEHGIDEIQGMATAMFGRFLLPFEATSLLLLATAVAVVVLAKRERGPRPSSQGAQGLGAHAARTLPPTLTTTPSTGALAGPAVPASEGLREEREPAEVGS